ncbi:MAG: hypothetical protein CW342_03040 [Thermoactinomycetaceae bacterium]|nr:hypothetical protein [Bacillota bacterium]MBO2531866.1 hypothetical protein [Thermoactinomycetaceae bacterium]
MHGFPLRAGGGKAAIPCKAMTKNRGFEWMRRFPQAEISRHLPLHGRIPPGNMNGRGCGASRAPKPRGQPPFNSLHPAGKAYPP